MLCSSACYQTVLLIPGFICGVMVVIWLFRQGLHHGRLWWILIGLSLIWSGAIILSAFGLTFWALIPAGLAFSGTILIMALLIKRQASQRSEISRLQRIAEVRSDRVSALSHEIRNPLAMIKGSVDLLLEGNPGPLTPQQLKFLQTISQNSEHLNILSEDLLTQARIEAGLFKLHLETTDVKALIRQSINNLRYQTDSREQKIRVDSPQVMEKIYADPRLITQAMINLLQNASRHTTHGGHIYVTIADNDSLVVISITDDGAGMTAEQRQKLFRKFSSGRPLGDGTGLGLVITKLIVELHGGQIMVDTQLGRGTTVLFTLPRWRNDVNGEAVGIGGG